MRTLAAGLLLLASTGAVAGCGAGADDPGPHSAFTREQLATAWPDADRFPLLVPVTMPDGADDADEPRFDLANVVVEPSEPAVRRVWLAFYEASALDAEHTQFRVFQRRAGVRSTAPSPCGATALPHVERTVGDAVLTICGFGLAENEKARTYWTTVELTTDYDAVDWID